MGQQQHQLRITHKKAHIEVDLDVRKGVNERGPML